MTPTLVIDSSVLIPLLVPVPGDDDHRGLEDALLDPRVDVIAPPLIDIEVLNVAARRRLLDATALRRLVAQLEALPIERFDPDLADTATWAATGMSAYDALFVALAEDVDARLLTLDADIRDAVPHRAVDRV
jgi:predicted nucleic acid-binding protein